MQRILLRYCTANVGNEVEWDAGGNEHISIATQNTCVLSETVVDLIGEFMQQLFRRGARKFAMDILLQTCESHRQARGSYFRMLPCNQES